MEHQPDQGLFVEDDLEGTTIGLTAQRGWLFFLGALAIASTVSTGFVAVDWTMSFALLAMPLGWLANQHRTDVHLGARAFRVQRRVFTWVLSRHVVAYSEVTTAEVRRRGLYVERRDGSHLWIKQGTADDHESIRRELGARRVLAGEAPAVPSELLALRPAGTRRL